MSDAQRPNPQRWKTKDSSGFFAFLEDVMPMVPSPKGGYEPYVLTGAVKEEVQRALDGPYKTLIFSFPRRHGKTLLCVLIILWRFLSRQTENIALVANNATQAVDVAYRSLQSIISETPYTRRLVDAGKIILQKDRIEYPDLRNMVQGFPASARALYGKRLTIGMVSELHATDSENVYSVIASSTLDTEDGLILIDSTTGPRSSPLYGLYQLSQSGADQTLYFSHIQYSDLQDAIDRAPPWLSVDMLKSRHAQMTPEEFGSQHLNRWSDGSKSLFPSAVIDRCKDDYPLDPEAIAAGRKYVVAAGLDRARGYSRHGDRTILTALMKVSGDDLDADECYVLDSFHVRTSGGEAIQSKLLDFHERFNMSKACLENHDVSDLLAWCSERNEFETETQDPTNKWQQGVFSRLYHAAESGRLHIHKSFKDIFTEMESFEHEVRSGQHGYITVFGHAKKAKDDRIYSLAHAFHATRNSVFSPYELNGILCDAPKSTARLCLLNGGGFEPPCSQSCRSFIEANKFYEQYLERSGAAPLSKTDFIRLKLANRGPHVTLR